ncbi:MAG: hypothetical protein ABI692_07110 [Terracoccus sp.]
MATALAPRGVLRPGETLEAGPNSLWILPSGLATLVEPLGRTAVAPHDPDNTGVKVLWTSGPSALPGSELWMLPTGNLAVVHPDRDAEGRLTGGLTTTWESGTGDGTERSL